MAPSRANTREGGGVTLPLVNLGGYNYHPPSPTFAAIKLNVPYPKPLKPSIKKVKNLKVISTPFSRNPVFALGLRLIEPSIKN